MRIQLSSYRPDVNICKDVKPMPLFSIFFFLVFLNKKYAIYVNMRLLFLNELNI